MKQSAEREPTRRELRLIEAEWPTIAAELAITDREIAAAQMGAPLSELDRQRVRRADPGQVRRIVETSRHPSDLGGAA